jgi:hypothetical protein
MAFADLRYWADIAAIVGAVGVAAAVAALVVGWAQLRKTATVTRGQMILAVDQALAPHGDIRREAQDRKWKPPPNTAADRKAVDHRRRIKEYMGVWERVETLLADNSLDLPTVHKLYGDRVRFLLRNEVIRSYVVERPHDWSAFHSLARRLATVEPRVSRYVKEIDGAIAEQPRSLADGAAAGADLD